MKIVEPRVEYWEQKNPVDLVCKCARTCYKSADKGHEANEKMYKGLVNNGHVSMLRHESHYYIIEPTGGGKFSHGHPYDAITSFRNSPYVGMKEASQAHLGLGPILYVSTNANFLHDNEWVKKMIDPYEVAPGDFQEECPELMRFTFMVDAARVINDEYARKSPNAIAGESTRYCNYSKDKFESEIRISTSDSYDNEALKMMNECGSATLEGILRRIYDNLLGGEKPMKGLRAEEALWFSNRISEEAYMHQTRELGRTPDDSRNCLPVNVASRFVYTYSVKEWGHILRMRLLGKTGKPHVDAHKIAGLIYGEFQKLGYSLNENDELEYTLNDGKRKD